MNWKWYFPVVIVILAFFGISLDQSIAPNQEIVVQFNAENLNADAAQRTISKITDQLTAVGVTDIHISENSDGTFKVIYFSTIAVSEIKNLLNSPQHIQLGDVAVNENNGFPKIPSNKNTDSYKLEVAKIQKKFGVDLGLRGLPVEVKVAKDQFVNTIISLGTAETVFNIAQHLESVAFTNYSTASLQLNTTSHKIPEVRAGPVS